MHNRLNKFLMAAAVAVAATLPSCAVYAKGASCDQLGRFAAAMLDDAVTAAEVERVFRAAPPETQLDYARLTTILVEVVAQVAPENVQSIPRVVTHLCYAKRGV